MRELESNAYSESSSLTAIQKDRQVGKDFATSVLHSGTESPWNGAAQLVNHVLDKDLIPELNVVGAPAPVEFGSARWHAQTIGGAIGILAPFFLVNKGVGRILGRGGIAAAESLPLSSRITQAALSGAVYDGVFHPVQPQQGDFWSARARNAVTGAATFATLAGVTGYAEKNGLWRSVAMAEGAGLAGLVNAQSKSLLEGNGFASGQNSVESIWGFLVGGAALGALHAKVDSVANRNIVELLRDGTILEAKSDGTVIRKSSDGTVREAKPDGTIVEVKRDGTVITQESNGSTVTRYPGTVVRQWPNGDVVETKGDGTIVTQKPDGTVVERKADGTAVTRKSDGTAVEQKPDGTVVETKSDGTAVTHWPDGAVSEKYPDGTSVQKRPFPESDRENPEYEQITTRHPDGVVVEAWPRSGRTITKNSDGTVVERNPGGPEVTVRPDLTQIEKYPPAIEGGLTRVVTRKPGGEVIEEWPEIGMKLERRPDGGVVKTVRGEENVMWTTFPDGTFRRTYGNGSVEEFDPNGRQTDWDPTGEISWKEFPNGITYRRHPDGTIKILTPDGEVLIKPGTPGARLADMLIRDYGSPDGITAFVSAYDKAKVETGKQQSPKKSSKKRRT